MKLSMTFLKEERVLQIFYECGGDIFYDDAGEDNIFLMIFCGNNVRHTIDRFCIVINCLEIQFSFPCKITFCFSFINCIRNKLCCKEVQDSTKY